MTVFQSLLIMISFGALIISILTYKK